LTGQQGGDILRRTMRIFTRGLLLGGVLLALASRSLAADADLILHSGKVVTVDSTFSIAEAVAVKDGRIVAVGRTADVISRERGSNTRMIDLKGQTVLPGLTDAHAHPLGAALSEYATPFAVLRSYADIQSYIRLQASKTPRGEWILVPKTFPGRLQEMRMPTRDVLDATQDHPVFYDASYASAINSYALKMSGITRDTPEPPGSRIVKDSKGEPTGILTGRATSLIKDLPREREFTEQEKVDALERMLKRYAAAGLTSVGDRGVSPEAFALYNILKKQNRLPVRVVMTGRLQLNQIEGSDWVTNKGDEWLKFGSFKVGLDGGMNAGTAYMGEPYGSYGAQLFGISDPANRGNINFTHDALLTIMRTARDKGWQLSAHSQGGGAVDALLTVFEILNKEKPIGPSRSHLIHASFQSPESIARARKIGALVDVQPVWLHFDGVSLGKVMSKDAMRYFIPLKSLVDAGITIAGGSDHMVGWDKNTAINAYNPFLGMWIAVTRKTAQGEVIHPEERLSREQALRMYTEWAAYMQHSEKDRGSIETGKLADLVIIDRDYLTCPENEIRNIEPVMTIAGGRVTYSR
jgi:predicted amidohydrolase YtcJ